MSIEIAGGDGRLPKVTARCDYCSGEVDVIEEYTLGNPAPHYIAGSCPCPRPRCVCCRTVIADGRCPDLWCPVGGVLQPLPDPN